MTAYSTPTDHRLPVGKLTEQPEGAVYEPSLSIVVPTRNEAGNVYPLLTLIHKAVTELPVEVIFVDDSTDDTPEVIRRVGQEFPFKVSVIARPADRRNGLGMAVVEGITAAKAEWVCVMDGDLQHPPEVIPQLLEHAQETGATLVAASRLTDGGSTAGLSWRRKVISYTLAVASRVLFPNRLRQLTDPLTGFFLVKREALIPDSLRPEGFKILLEILVRTPHLRLAELPFEFGERLAGESKANTQEAFKLFQQLLRLSLEPHRYLLRFFMVGASGLLVNTLAMMLATFVGLHVLIAATVATQTSTLWNFSLLEAWAYKDREFRQKERWQRLTSFLVMNNAALLLRGPLMVFLISFDMHYLVANAVTLIAIAFLRYAVSDSLIWRKGRATSTSVAVASSVNTATQGE